MSKLPLEHISRALIGATEVLLSSRENNSDKMVRDWDYLNDVAATPEIIASMAHEILNQRQLAEEAHRARVLARQQYCPGDLRLMENDPVCPIRFGFVKLPAYFAMDSDVEMFRVEGFRTEPKKDGE